MFNTTAGLVRSRFLLAALCGLAVFCLGMLSCGPAGYSIDVNVMGLTDDVVQLAVTATFGKQTANSVVSQSLDQFALRLVFDNQTPGTMQLTVSGVGTDGCQRSVGVVPVELPAMGPVAVTLVPDRGCKIVVRRTGDGKGEVHSPDGTLSCKFDGTLPPAQQPLNPVPTTNVADACVFYLPLGSQVTLAAFAAQDSSPRAYFAGWTSGCAGKAPCQIAVSAGKTEVGVGLLPTQVCSTDHFCWENPTPTGNGLGGVWGSSADDVWLVGGAGTILHWNGTFLAAFASGTDNPLFSVWGSGPSDVWAVGLGGTILHYDGVAWQLVPNIGNYILKSVWGSGPKDIWAVGVHVILHYDGTWTSVTTNAALTGVWGSGPNNVWAVENLSESILHYDGTEWKSISVLASSLWAVWGSGPNDIWAVGRQIILHYDGSTWSKSASPATDHADLVSVWGSGPDDVWAVDDNGEIFHYDGKTWRTDRSATAPMSALWGSGPGDVWAVGSIILHLNGASWVTQSNDSLNLGLNGVWGSGLSDVWAVGIGGTILHYNGDVWLSAKSPTTSSLNAVWGSGPGDVWAVSNNGIFLHYDGSAWSQSSSQTPANLHGIWGSGPGDVWAVGDNGTILHHVSATASDNWISEDSRTTVPLQGVWGSGPSDIWAVGNRGTLLHRSNGSSWTSVVSGTADELSSIWGSGATDIWILATTDGPVHFNGKEWQAAPPLMKSSTLQTIFGNGTTDVWIVGNGDVFHREGGSFKNLQSGTTTLKAGWSGGPGDAIVVGDFGTILHHTPQ